MPKQNKSVPKKYLKDISVPQAIYTKKGLPEMRSPFFIGICDSHGARTHDPNIKSVVLYQLS